MKKKYLIISSILCALSIATLLIMLMPIIKDVDTTVFDLIKNVDKWYYFEEYIWGIAGIIATVCLPLLIISTILCILSACGVIKSEKLDKILYIVNIILAVLVVCIIVNYTLGLGCSIEYRGINLFKGTTYFKYATAFYYLHCVLSILILVLSCLNKSKIKNK